MNRARGCEPTERRPHGRNPNQSLNPYPKKSGRTKNLKKISQVEASHEGRSHTPHRHDSRPRPRRDACELCSVGADWRDLEYALWLAHLRHGPRSGWALFEKRSTRTWTRRWWAGLRCWSSTRRWRLMDRPRPIQRTWRLLFDAMRVPAASSTSWLVTPQAMRGELI